MLMLAFIMVVEMKEVISWRWKNCSVDVPDVVDYNREGVLGLRKSSSCPAFFSVLDSEPKKACCENALETEVDGFELSFDSEDIGDGPLSSSLLSTVSDGGGLSARASSKLEALVVREYEVAIISLARVLCLWKKFLAFGDLRTTLEQCACNVQRDLHSCQSFQIAICILFLEWRKSDEIFNYTRLYIFVEGSNEVWFLDWRGRLVMTSRESVFLTYRDVSRSQRKRMLAVYMNNYSQCSSLDLILVEKQKSVKQIVEQAGVQVHGKIGNFQFLRFLRQSACDLERQRVHRSRQLWATCICMDGTMSICYDFFVGVNLWMANGEIFLYRSCDTMSTLTRESLRNQGGDNSAFATICINGWFVDSRFCGWTDKERCGDYG
jgi:hypothetical protein